MVNIFSGVQIIRSAIKIFVGEIIFTLKNNLIKR